MSTEWAKRVTAEVRAEMARQDVSQENLAELLEMSPATMSRRLRGSQPFDLDELAKVALALHVPVSSFTNVSEGTPENV